MGYWLSLQDVLGSITPGAYVDLKDPTKTDGGWTINNEQYIKAISLGILEELKKLNRLLHCPNFSTNIFALKGIERVLNERLSDKLAFPMKCRRRGCRVRTRHLSKRCHDHRRAR